MISEHEQDFGVDDGSEWFDHIKDVCRATGLIFVQLLRDNQDRNRIASLTDVPERLGHCLT